MKIQELQLALEREQSRLGLSDNELAELTELMSACGQLTVEEFCKRSAHALAASKKPTAKPRANVLNEVVVAKYVRELHDTQSSRPDFEAVVDRLSKDRAVRLPEAKEIASRFTGGTTKYKTKKEAFSALSLRQMSDQRAALKAKRISDLF